LLKLPKVKAKDKQKKQKLKDKILLSLIVIFCVGFIVIGLGYVLNPTPINPPEPPPLYAVVLDPLSVTQPNQTFIDGASEILEDAGFEVDVFSKASVTVDFYKTLATKGYDVIIFRTHSGILMNATGQPIPGDPVFLFTAEEYDPTKHNWLLLNDLVAPANPWDTETFYFAISPSFVRETMQGSFNDTVIIIDGCHGLYSTTMADAFISRGASVIISWDDKVTAPHMDAATILLLEKLLMNNESVYQAVEETKNKVGPDPTGGILTYYPLSLSNSTIWDLIE